jgi:hypothetical protein
MFAWIKKWLRGKRAPELTVKAHPIDVSVRQHTDPARARTIYNRNKMRIERLRLALPHAKGDYKQAIADELNQREAK